MIRLPKLRRRHYGVIAAAVVLLLAGTIFYGTLSNKGQIIENPAQTSVVTAPYKDYDGAYMTFRYSSKYQKQDIDAKDGDLELAMLTVGTNYDKKLAVSVSKLEGSRLDTNSAYLLRKSQPTNYTSQFIMVDGSQVTIWSKTDGLEETVFIPKGDIVAVLSFSTAGTVDNLDAEVTGILDSYAWKARL